MTTIEFGIAHNNEAGDPTRRAFEITLEVGDELALHIEAKDLQKGELLFIDDKWITFTNGCGVRYLTRHEWAGNMFWNNYKMTIASGLGFLYLLQQSGNWNVIEGLSELFEKFAGNVEITAADIGADETIKKLYRTPGQYSLFHAFLTHETGELAFYFSTGND